MQPIATDDPVAWCVSLFATLLSWAKTAERIEVLFVVETSPKTHTVVDGGPYSEGRRVGENFAHRNMNIAHIQCGLRQITLASCHSLLPVDFVCLVV